MRWPNRLLIYLFPIPIWVVEYLMRLAVGGGPHAGEFFTASLSAAAIGLCLPVCVPKTFPTEKFEEMTGVRLEPGLVIRTVFDSDLVPFGWMAGAACFVVWACALFVSIHGGSPSLTAVFEVPRGQIIAVIMYFIAVLLTEFKERA
jgi:hypothetical protein